ncbi:MAG: type II toxin-antitoxin system VapC family toxin [Herminiimonas sp.]|nr:type II toxin-antitoxin system VapC family toxin [Herminiimonas sp.]
MLIDTDVLIWMTRGHAGATARLQALVPWRISAVTYMELAQGCRNRQELDRIKKGLALCQTVILPVSTAISDRAMQLIDAYALSHRVQLGDALIAATALEHALTVLTANTKHFSAVDGLQIEAFMP